MPNLTDVIKIEAIHFSLIKILVNVIKIKIGNGLNFFLVLNYSKKIEFVLFSTLNTRTLVTFKYIYE